MNFTLISYYNLFFEEIIIFSWEFTKKLVLHVSFQTWMYISIPLLIYVGERTLRALRSKAYAVKILKVIKLINEFSSPFIVSNK
jgi:hypothetical protein